MLVNSYNYLRWDDGTIPPTSPTEPAKGYERDKSRCDYLPLLINGEPLVFYINTLDGLNSIIPDVSDLSISSQANITASEWAFTLSGTPKKSDIVTVAFTVDAIDYNVASTVLAGWTLTDLINDLYNQIVALNPDALPYANMSGNGVLIQGSSTASGIATVVKYSAATSAKLKLVSISGQVVNSNIATLNQDFFVTEDGQNVFTYYASVSPANIAPGIYFFRIGDDTTNFLDSNLLIIPNDDYLKYSCLCKFRQDRYFYGVNYQNLPDFYQQFRLHFNEVDKQYEQDKDIYNEVTTGKQRTYNNYKKKLRTFETYYFDDFAHDAAEIMFDSDLLFINGKQFVLKGTYKVLTQPLSKVKKGQADCYDEDFATANRCLIPITAGGGGDICVGVSIPSATLPDGFQGVFYNYAVTLTGDQPFQLTDKVEPPGLHWGLSGDQLSLSGTPTASGTQLASVTVNNCADVNSDSFSGTFNVVEHHNLYVTLTGSDGVLEAFIDDSVIFPVMFHFFCVTSGGACHSYSITSPDQTLSSYTANTFYSFTDFVDSIYTFKCTVTDADGNTGTSNSVVETPCLALDTMIMMQDSSQKRIDELEKGERLFDSIVTSIQKRTVSKLFIINNGLLKASAKHVHVLSDWSLVQSDKLKVGDKLQDKFGLSVEIISIEIIEGIFNVVTISTDTKIYIANGIITHNKLTC